VPAKGHPCAGQPGAADESGSHVSTYENLMYLLKLGMTLHVLGVSAGIGGLALGNLVLIGVGILLFFAGFWTVFYSLSLVVVRRALRGLASDQAERQVADR
jgi:hypothetical protein